MVTIYLSSTYEDLKEHRRVVYEALRKAGHHVIAMEDYVATDQRPVDKCLKDVEMADIYVGLFAFRYGYVPPANHNNPNGLSVTELEFRHAERLKKPCLVFMVNDTTAWSRGFDDAYTADDKGARIKALRQHLLTEKLASQFSEPHQLSALVLVAVTRYLTENKQPATVRVEESGSIAAVTQNIAIRSRPQSLGMVEPVASMSRILISYRREDSADVTGRIYDRLVQQFGRETVFKDVDSIPLGVDFRTYLDEQVNKCDVFLAVIGRDWLKAEGRKGRSRLDDLGDFVRIEIEAALKRRIPVIPVLVSGASIPPAERLPASIQDLSYRNGIPVRSDPDFHRDMDRLVDRLRTQLERRQEHLPSSAAQGMASGVSSKKGAGHSRIGRSREEGIEVKARPSGLDSQQRGAEQDEDEKKHAAPAAASRTTTERALFYMLGGIGMIAFIGFLVAFPILPPKPSSVEFSQGVGQKEEQHSASSHAEPVAVPKKQDAPVENQVIAKQPSIKTAEVRSKTAHQVEAKVQNFKAVDTTQPPSSIEDLSKELDAELRKIKTLDMPKAAPPVDIPTKPVPQVEAKVPSAKAVDTTLKVPGMAPGSNAYLALVRQRISNAWNAPPMDLTSHAYVVVVQFRLHKNGSVTGVTIEQTSGNEYYDLAGKRAVLSANPLPVFPADITGPYFDAHFTFTVGEPQG